MKKNLILFFISISLLACSGDDDSNNVNNPNLNIPIVNLNLNLNLPEFTILKFPGNSVTNTSQGVKGIVIYSINDNMYSAFELSDPNHSPSSCSRMVIETPLATCECSDGNIYNIITGEHSTQDNTKYPMYRYNAVREGDVIHVYN